MTLWIVVGRGESGDEPVVFETEAFGPFADEDDAQEWLDTAPTFDGQVYELLPPDVEGAPKGSRNLHPSIGEDQQQETSSSGRRARTGRPNLSAPESVEP